jgi:hypothetical protein
MPSADALNAIRSWIAVCQASAPTLGDDLTASIPDDFVKQRQTDSRVGVHISDARALETHSDAKQVSAQHLGRWLTMAKLLARSHGIAAVTRDCWEEALRLDAVHRSS